jgi:WD40 repeat protein
MARRNRAALFFLAAIGSAAGARSPAADAPPAEPILRIETALHTSVVTSISTDAAGRYAVTASLDRTARVWDIASGAPRVILRPPIDHADMGKLMAVAMSPDGESIAVGGFTEKLRTNSVIYIFSRSSGQVIRRLPEIPGLATGLAFSPDGQWLAVRMEHGGFEILNWRNVNERLKPELSDLDTPGFLSSLTWSADNRLATTSSDSQIRLYEVRNIRLTKLLQVPCGPAVPWSIAFSPNGQLLALGFDVPHVIVLNSKDLRSAYEPDVHGIEGFDVARVAWSSDGETLYASGNSRGGAVHYVRAWAGAGRGKRIDVSTYLTGAATSDLKTLPGERGRGGGVLISLGDAAWGTVDPAGQAHIHFGPTTYFAMSQGDKAPGLPVSRDAGQVQVAYRQAGRSPQLFNVSTRQFSQNDAAKVSGARIDGLSLTDWPGPKPLLNGQPLSAIDDGDLAKSIAVAPDGRSFVVGGVRAMYRLDANGNLLWRRSVPVLTSTVNIAASGQVVVAGYNDGTIRWHRLSDGQELLAFFPHDDGKRWVLWTPSGYYDASPGGEDLIGWHVNRGAEQAADFFPAAKFRSRFNRPDVIDRVLTTLDETSALTAADAARGVQTSLQASIVQSLPPVLELVTAGDVTASQAQLGIRYRVRSAADAPVTKVFARVNGLAQSTARRIDVVGSDDSQEIAVNVPAHDSEVQIFAENRHGVSTAAVVRVKWVGTAAAVAAIPRTADSSGFETQPKLYLLAIGVSAYRSKDIPKLAFAAKDARDFAQAMQRQQGKLYKTVETKIVTDEDATKDDIMDGLDWLGKQMTQHDVGMLFLSGHGANDSSLGFVYLPVDADLHKLKRTAVTMADISTTIRSMAGKAVAFLDTCHSGSILGSGQKGLNDMSGVINELASAENGLVVFSSSTGRQFSLENASWNNGAFTKALVEGIDGRADEQHSGRVTYKMLDLYVSERVKALTQGNQSPVTQAPGGVNDFPLALTK